MDIMDANSFMIKSGSIILELYEKSQWKPFKMLRMK
jgi:hypothetical protein